MVIDACAYTSEERKLAYVYSAGIPLQTISGSQTSVFCGCFTNDYNAMTTKDLQNYPKYTVTGTGNSILANRISYFYNLHGPSATIDTACSSSLVCFHMGNQSIRNGESDLAIVVGSALHFDPNIFITMTDLGMLSTDGRCRAFDALGRGYVRGEGVCAAVLKRKGRADLDGDIVRAVVRGTAVNHDGRKQGITLPSSEAQENLIRHTYKTAKIDPADTQYFEAHGTGTAAGDPRETRAIGAVFSTGRNQPLSVGSIKTNIGHLEGASGLAGIIKATLSLENKTIPPNMHFETPNPEIDFDRWNISVPTKATPWLSPEGLRRASINSFGYGGTNAHVILERHDDSTKMEPPLPKLPEQFSGMVNERPYLLSLSTHSPKAGSALVQNLINYLERQPDISPDDLAYSLSSRRSLHTHRSFAIGNDKETLVSELKNLRSKATWTPAKEHPPKLGFVMTGQGGQWFAMGRQLMKQSPFFLQTLERCDKALRKLPDAPEWSIIEELLRSKEESRLAETRFSQPVCTALQVAILEMLKQWRIVPTAVVGHSSGELAAAYGAGILSFENTIIAAYYRGLYISNVVEGMKSKPGAMLAVGMSENEARMEIQPYEGRIALAAINSPSTMTLSGDEDAIAEVKKKLGEKNVFARQLQVAQAFHSHHMYPLAPGYEDALGSHRAFRTQGANIRMFSSVTARVANPSHMGARYWAKNMTDTVRFSDALTGIVLDDLDAQNVDILVEIGPHPALQGPSRQVLQSLKLDIPYLASLRRGTPDYESLLALAGQLFTHGYPVDLLSVNSDLFLVRDDVVGSIQAGRKLKDLPSYSWDHTSYWAETRLIKDHRLRPHRHSLLGAPLPGSIASHPSWRNHLRLNELPWLSGHMIEGKVVFPAAGYVSMAIEAIRRLVGSFENIQNFALSDIAIKSALSLTDAENGTEVMLELRPASGSTKVTSDTWHEFTIFSFDGSGRSMEHCRGLISAEIGPPIPLERIKPCLSLMEMEKNIHCRTTSKKHYEHLYSLGLQYGENFKLLSGDVESGPGFAIAPLNFNQSMVSTQPEDVCILHSVLLDASFHVAFAAIESQLGRPLNEAFVPTFLRSMKVSGVFANAGASLDDQAFKVYSEASLPSPRVATNEIRLHAQGSDQLLVDIHDFKLTALGGDSTDTGPKRSLFFRTRWQPSFDHLGSSNFLGSIRGIEQLMDLFAHQHPNAQILHLGPDVESSKHVLSTLGGRERKRRRFQSYTPFPASAIGIQELSGMWAPSLFKIEEPKLGNYDLVVVEECSIHKSEPYIKPGGYLITKGSINVDKNVTPLFSTLDLNVWRLDLTEAIAVEPLTLLIAPLASERTKAIVSLIEAAYPDTVAGLTIAQLAELEPNEISRRIVVFASLDEDLFFTDANNNSAHFAFIQRLLTRRENNIVWLLEGATMDSQRPEHAIISGLARSARSENDRLRLVTLDVAKISDVERIAQCALEALDPRNPEDELTERNKTLFIPRIEPDDTLNARIPGGVNSGPYIGKFGQDRPLALTIGKVGLLETLAFDEDERLVDSSLGNDELEIEVKASAINFRDIAAAIGIIEDHKLGDECSGIVIRKGAMVDESDFRSEIVLWLGDLGKGLIARSSAILRHCATN